MSESKGEGGSWLYGLLLMLSGAFILVTGILGILGIDITGWMPLGTGSIITQGYVELTIGAWGIIGGVGLIKDQEWGWGIALVVLTIVIVKTLSSVIAGIMNLITNPLDAITDVMFWIYIAPFVIAVIGIIYLLATKEKYA
ncbi:MAG: hypothetical protein EU549_02805 [Promethearchaeota archaeon]|nr:MAG: hypothetical protein EU549_02805 [Candidatus Lokiarchaeota archaeon]